MGIRADAVRALSRQKRRSTVCFSGVPWVK